MTTFPKLISGFTVIPVTYAQSTHIIYARAHKSSSSSSKSQKTPFPPNRTLFLVNIPVDATDREISLFFKHCGTIERVIYDGDSLDDGDAQEGDDSEEDETEEEDGAGSSMDVDAQDPQDRQPPKKKRKGQKDEKTKSEAPLLVPLPTVPLRTLRKTGSNAHVVFLDTSSLAKALTPSKPRPWPSSDEPRGLHHYAAFYDAQRPPLDVVKAHADSAMEVYEYELAKNKQSSAYRKGEAIVDEDGFTLVTRGGAYGQTLGGGVSVASKAFQTTGKTGSKRKKEPKEKEAFYAFQKAEKQRKVIMDLKKNFEADKVRVEKMKESRRFKPY